jgi:transposase-like protein
MKNASLYRCNLTIAQRAQIIQRVLVDGWTIAEVATSYGVPKRLVDSWVADFRKSGMSSLRHQPGQTIATEIARSLRTALRRISIGIRRSSTVAPVVEPLPMRQLNRDRPG